MVLANKLHSISVDLINWWIAFRQHTSSV